YLDAIARPWASAFLSIIPVVFVVPLNWLLIYGNWGAPKLGLVGAGAATLLAQTLGVVIMWLYTATSTSPDGSQKRWRIDFRRFVRLGLPMSLQYLAESSAIGVIGLLVGLLGSTALAANQVALSLGELLYMIPLGVAGAVGILIAQAVGENSREQVRAIGLASFGLVAMITLPLAAIMAIYNNSIARAFVEDREVVALLSGLLLTMAGVQVFDGLQTVALGALRGLLDNRWPTVTALISYWLVAVPFSVLLGFGLNLGAAGIWMGFGLGVALASLTLVTRFILQSGRPELPVGSAD
ncbi:MAG: MATE family efflux transporter, partial [Candidatus Binatia bacterium]